MVKKNIVSILVLLFLVILIAEIGFIYTVDFGFTNSTKQETDPNLAVNESTNIFNSDFSPLESNDFTMSKIPQLLDYDINLVFFGINKTRLIEDSLVRSLPQWYAPIDGTRYWFDKQIVFDINFTLSYHPYYIDQEILQDYRDFLYINSKVDRAPWFIQPEHATANYIHSSLVEEYLAQNVIIDSIPTLIIIDTYSFDPNGHTPYYYNATYNELDAEFGGYSFNPVPWGSTYQIAGGAKDSRLLWLDLSAGPTFYAGYSFEPTEGEVSNSTIPPIWTYEGVADAETRLTQDLVKYITKAVETRIIPSYTYIPPSPTKEIKLEMIMVDFDPSDYDYFSVINGSYIVSEYQRINPLINWTYSISEWDWESDDEFIENINLVFDNSTNTFYIQEFQSYLDNKYTDLFNVSTTEREIIPVILFTYPPYYRFEPDWGGFAKTVYDEEEEMWKFGYIFCRQNSHSADPDFIESDSVTINNFEISQGSSFINSFHFGIFNQILELSVEMNSGLMNIYFLDDYNYNRFNQSLPFIDLFNNSMENLSNLSGLEEVRILIKINGFYHLIVENIGNSSSSFNFSMSISRDWMAGFTWKTMHEVGHAIGLNHPHQGFSWQLSGMYYYWLWDFSYSQVCYANNAQKISIMDIDTVMRGMIPSYWKKAVEEMQGIIDLLSNPNFNSPDNISVYLIKASSSFNQSMAHYSDNVNPNHYYNSLHAIFETFNELELALNMLNKNQTIELIVPIAVGIAAILIVSISYIILRSLKRKRNMVLSKDQGSLEGSL